MSNHWFNPNYPPPPLPSGANNYNPQANYSQWNNGSYQVPAQFSIPPPNFNQPPPHVYNQYYQYEYSSSNSQNYNNQVYPSSSTHSDTSLNYAEELESYRNTKAHYEKAQNQKNTPEKSRSKRSCSRDRQRKYAR